MKRIALAVICLVFIALITSSCTSHQKCDAYGSKNRDKVETVRY